MTITNWSMAALFAAAVVAGCGGRKDESAPKDADEEADATQAPSTDPVQMSVTVAEARVPLGGEIIFRVNLKTTGAAPVQVNVPRLDHRSVTFRVRRPDGTITWLDRTHNRERQDGRMEPDPPTAKSLAPGEAFTQDVPVVAVQAGKFSFSPLYTRQGSPAALSADAVAVEVLPDGDKARLGVRLETSHGELTAVLRPDLAYNTVESFASLVRRGFYDGVRFHRIIRGFMAQGGDPKGNGSGGPGYCIPREIQAQLFHHRGVLSMARAQAPDSAGSQFFILFAAHPELDGQYATFGEMVEGETTLGTLEAVPTAPNAQGNEASVPKDPVSIRKATLVTIR